MRVCYSDGRPSKWIDEENMTGELTFTDDDLRWLKEYEIDWLRYPSRLAALIARLEAAEKAMMECHKDYVSPTYFSAYLEWRKAAGK
jgi:hypothetical protein